jgi:hypothetical protein
LVTLILFGEVYKLWSSPLRSLLQPPVISSFVGPNTPNPCYSLVWERPSFAPIKIMYLSVCLF